MNETTTTPNPQAQRACLAWISDPGHAWLAVSLDEFPQALEFASSYSYRGNKNEDFPAGIVFLEEDVDAFTFMRRYDIETTHIENTHFDSEDHFIRNLPSARKN